MRDFSDGCRGKADEKSDIESNREHFVITNSSLRFQSVRVSPSGMSADTSVACSFTSRITKCEPGDKACVVGSVGTVAGDCALTAVYEQQRWWLCTSNFLNGRADLAGIQVLLLAEAELTCFVVHELDARVQKASPIRIAACALATLVGACGGSPMAPNPTSAAARQQHSRNRFHQDSGFATERTGELRGRWRNSRRQR